MSSDSQAGVWREGGIARRHYEETRCPFCGHVGGPWKGSPSRGKLVTYRRCPTCGDIHVARLVGVQVIISGRAILLDPDDPRVDANFL